MAKKKKTILIAPNSFKECADSVTIANLIEQNLRKLSNYKLIKKPLSDGGDGFLELCKTNSNLEIIKYKISTPYNNSKISCEIGYDKKNKLVYIESASVLGLKVIPKSKRHPTRLSSKGLGDLLLSLMKDVKSEKIFVDKVIIGIGGTGTNDLGLGMCSRFGLKIYNNHNENLEIIPQNFNNATKISWDTISLPFELILIIDVNNQLLGINGATKIYGKQKGLTKEEIKNVENGFNNIINILKNKKIYNPHKVLSGAGGGLAAGFQIFFKAQVTQSFNFILDLIKELNIESIDSVITGEGAFDRQSMMKKASGSILEIFSGYDIPIFLCCGILENKTLKFLNKNVKTIQIADYFDDYEESIKKYKTCIKKACTEISNVIGN